MDRIQGEHFCRSQSEKKLGPGYRIQDSLIFRILYRPFWTQRFLDSKVQYLLVITPRTYSFLNLKERNKEVLKAPKISQIATISKKKIPINHKFPKIKNSVSKIKTQSRKKSQTLSIYSWQVHTGIYIHRYKEREKKGPSIGR